MSSPLIPLAIVAILAVVTAFASASAGQRRILVCSVIAPAVIQIAVASWLIFAAPGGGSFFGLWVFLLSLFAVPGGLIVNVLVNAKWKTQSPWWATVRGILVAALAYVAVMLLVFLFIMLPGVLR